MRYTEQLKYSWGYNWGLFREIWDMFTLQNWHWLVGGLLVVLCVLPDVFLTLMPSQAIYYISTPIPAFAPSLTQELAITYYCWKVGRDSLFFWVFNYYWVTSKGVQLLSMVLSGVLISLLFGAYFREK